MDAAQTNTKKIALFLAMALVLTAPVHGTNPAPVLTPAGTTVNLGSVLGCNSFQNLALVSSDGTTNIQFTVAVNYPNGNNINGDVNGLWINAVIPTTVNNLGGSTSSGTTFNATTGAGPNGVMLTIGLARTFAESSDTATVILTPTGPAGVNTTPIDITVNYQNNNSCGGNTGTAGDGMSALSGTMLLSCSSNLVALCRTQYSR